MNTVSLRIYTPNGLAYKNEITMIETTTYKGRIGMCANQIPLVALIKPNLTVIKTDKGQEKFYLFNGLVYQKPKHIRIFTNELYIPDANTEKKWLAQKVALEAKIAKTTDATLLIALNHQLKDLTAKLDLIIAKLEII